MSPTVLFPGRGGPPARPVGASPRYCRSPGNEEQVAVEERRCAPQGGPEGRPYMRNLRGQIVFIFIVGSQRLNREERRELPLSSPRNSNQHTTEIPRLPWKSCALPYVASSVRHPTELMGDRVLFSGKHPDQQSATRSHAAPLRHV